ncbi:sigma-E factor negative regulatory protein [Massilia sp. Root418]|uniref:sigma-E factor negative regulatory protein n=1 Tax=Massilia sp. Root418 TaxID=1736532 RepID=UPI0009E88375|nr:sigma-E factor negative regulatory protein [Massilia sp. Root418]
MDTLKRLHEHISAMVDGELSDHEAGLAVAALSEPEGQATWRAYHLIGDVLRSDASGAELGEGFTARLAARLDVEVPPAPGRAAPAPNAAASASAFASSAAPPAAPPPAVPLAATLPAVPAPAAAVPAQPASAVDVQAASIPDTAI